MVNQRLDHTFYDRLYVVRKNYFEAKNSEGIMNVD